jgi:hypothetical protein
MGAMAAWLCPACGRQFGRTNQSHACVPPMPLEQYLARLEPAQRATCSAVLDYLATLGEITVDAVNVGILVKRHRTFAELRPMKGRMALSFLVSRSIEDPRIKRDLALSKRRRALYADLHRPEDLDAGVREWLREAYLDSPL